MGKVKDFAILFNIREALLTAHSSMRDLSSASPGISDRIEENFRKLEDKLTTIAVEILNINEPEMAQVRKKFIEDWKTYKYSTDNVLRKYTRYIDN